MNKKFIGVILLVFFIPKEISAQTIDSQYRSGEELCGGSFFTCSPQIINNKGDVFSIKTTSNGAGNGYYYRGVLTNAQGDKSELYLPHTNAEGGIFSSRVRALNDNGVLLIDDSDWSLPEHRMRSYKAIFTGTSEPTVGEALPIPQSFIDDLIALSGIDDNSSFHTQSMATTQSGYSIHSVNECLVKEISWILTPEGQFDRILSLPGHALKLADIKDDPHQANNYYTAGSYHKKINGQLFKHYFVLNQDRSKLKRIFMNDFSSFDLYGKPALRGVTGQGDLIFSAYQFTGNGNQYRSVALTAKHDGNWSNWQIMELPKLAGTDQCSVVRVNREGIANGTCKTPNQEKRPVIWDLNNLNAGPTALFDLHPSLENLSWWSVLKVTDKDANGVYRIAITTYNYLPNSGYGLLVIKVSP